MTDWDTDAVFNDDYLYFYESRVAEESSDAEVELLLAVAEISAGDDVLDLGCGHGRIANRLAAFGASVTGIDITPLFLDLARADAQRRGVSVEYVEGDMRSLPWRDRFDVVVCWFTAFGYFDDADNRRVLSEVSASLRAGGRFVVELNHRDNLMRRWCPAGVTERDGDLLVDSHRFDPLTSRDHVTRTTIKDGAVVRTANYFTRLFTFTELRDWLLEAGFGRVEAFGSDARPLGMDSPRMIMVAHR